MSEYVIITDSSCDLSEKKVNELGIISIPLQFEIEGVSYQNHLDERDIKNKDYYSKLRKGAMSSTSQVNPAEFEELFEEVLKEGKDVLYIGFSSGLSGTFHSSTVAREELISKYPNRKLICVDTLAASLGEGLIVSLACKLKEEGKSIDEVANWVDENKLNIAHWFTVSDLNFLKRGGRVSATSAFLGTMLNVQPILHMDDNGKLIPMQKVRGRNTSIKTLAKNITETMLKDKCNAIFISHGDCEEDAITLSKLLKESIDFEIDIYINMIGPVIGGHAGPGTLAVFAYCTNR